MLVLNNSHNSLLYVIVHLYRKPHVLKYLFIKRRLCPSGSLLKYWYHLSPSLRRNVAVINMFNIWNAYDFFIYCSQTLSFLLQNIKSDNILDKKPHIISRTSSVSIGTSVLPDKEQLCRETYNTTNQREKIEMIFSKQEFLSVISYSQLDFFNRSIFFHINE